MELVDVVKPNLINKYNSTTNSLLHHLNQPFRTHPHTILQPNLYKNTPPHRRYKYTTQH